MGRPLVTTRELASAPALNDFFGHDSSPAGVGTGRAKTLTTEFLDGTWRAILG